MRKITVSDFEATYVLENEGHTMASMIRARLLERPEVVMAAYKLNNPMSKEVEIYVKTKKGGATTDDVFGSAVVELREMLAVMQDGFAKALIDFSSSSSSSAAACQTGSGSPRKSPQADASGKMGSKTESGL